MLHAKWRCYLAARLEHYVQNGAVIWMAGFTHRPSVSNRKKYVVSYNIYGFAINRIYQKTLQYVYLGFSMGVKVVEKFFFECENKSRCE